MTYLQPEDAPVAEIPTEEWEADRIDRELDASRFSPEPWLDALLPWCSVDFPEARQLDRHSREGVRFLLQTILLCTVFFAFASASTEPGWHPGCLPQMIFESFVLVGVAFLLLPLLLVAERFRARRRPRRRIVVAAALALGGYAVMLAILAPVRWLLTGYSMAPVLRAFAFLWMAAEVVPRLSDACGLSRAWVTAWLGATAGTALLVIGLWGPTVSDCCLRIIGSGLT